MLSFCIHHIYMDNRSPAPHTTWGSPELIARHQHGQWYNSVQHTTKQHKSICERRNARPHSRSRLARPQITTCDCPGHPDRHRPTGPHAAAQSMPEAVARRRILPGAPQLPFRRRGIVLPRDRPARHGCKLVCWFCREGAQASRSAAQPGLVSCGSPASSRSGLRSVCSSSACRR